MPTNELENAVVLVMNRGDEDVSLITSLLEKAGFGVFHSAEQSEVLRYCRAVDEDVHLAIIDTATRGIQVSELLEQVRAINPRIRCLLMSNADESERIGNWRAKGNVHGHISRPFRRAQFLGSVLEADKGQLVRTA